MRRFCLLLGQVLACVGLILMGWGFSGLPDFLSDGARAGLVAVAVLSGIASAALGLELHPLRKGTAAVGKQKLEIGGLWLASLFLLWFLPFADRRRLLTLNDEFWRCGGLVIFCIGAVVRIFGMKALGKYFSVYVTLQPQHRLVRTGIYCYIRHPLYLSLILAPTGMGLVFESKLALPILLFASMFVLDRIRKEERLLAEHFGAEFVVYRQGTWGVVPFLI